MQDISKNSGAHRGGIEYKWIALSNTTLSIMLAFNQYYQRPVGFTRYFPGYRH